MGAPYQSQSASNYNASPPPDDGSTVSANKITWASIKSKLSDPIKTLSDAINTALRAALNVTPSTTSIAYTTVLGDHLTTIEATGSFTISLGDCATMIAQSVGYTVSVYNKGTGTITVGVITATDTLSGRANGTVSLPPGAAMTFTAAQSGVGYDIVSAAGFSPVVLTGAAGTNTATANAPANLLALYSGLYVLWTPANTNTGATTLNITPSGGAALGAKNVFSNGAACVGNELVANQPAILVYDGTQFNITSLIPGTRLLATAVASNSATIDFTAGITSAYDEYIFTITGLTPATDNTDLWLRISLDSGATFKAGATDYDHQRILASAGDAAAVVQGANGDTKILIAAALNNGQPFSGEVKIFGPSTGVIKMIQHQCTYRVTSSAKTTTVSGSGAYTAAGTAINGIRFLMSSGNITVGNVAMYGVRKS